MEVKSYKKLKSNVYEVTLDTLESYKLYDDVILKYELLIDKKMDKKTLNKIIEENTLLEAYYKSLKYLNVKMRSELEIKKYLKKYETPDSAIGYAIDRLKKEGYLDSDKYAKAYVTDAVNLTSNGPEKITASLKMLGVPEHISKKYIDEVPYEEWIGRIEKIVSKKAKSSKIGESLFKNKMYSYLISLGYKGEDIRTVLNEFSLDNKETFIKEADKTYNSLQVKYSGSELKARFKNKMYAKGFSTDQINDFLHSKSD